MSKDWWPTCYGNIDFEQGVEAAMEAVAQRLEEEHRGFLTVVDSIYIDAYNRRWLGLERKEG